MPKSAPFVPRTLPPCEPERPTSRAQRGREAKAYWDSLSLGALGVGASEDGVLEESDTPNGVDTNRHSSRLWIANGADLCRSAVDAGLLSR
jgi:hypothetical protein